MPNMLIITATLLVGGLLCNDDDEEKDLETSSRLFKATNRATVGIRIGT